MKAFILAAGNGTRLRPLTDNLPKCLLPVRGVPLLAIWLENCKTAGIDEVLINAHAHGEKVREFAAIYSGEIKIHVTQEEQLLGSAGTLAENHWFVDGESAFFVLYGDVLTSASLCEMASFHLQKRQLATLGVCQVPDPQRCGIVTIDHQGLIQKFQEKPAQPEGNWAFSGVMMASPEILDCIPSHRPADIGFDLLPQLAGKMAAYKISEYLLDIGTLHNYNMAQTSWPGLQA
ncbi:MAG TPA: nucleotidyltransferase family protein [Candidatus Angelobacter sp.]|nr:nucleotidyltransferase family protein [Candidatus Angelobacter sp.]